MRFICAGGIAILIGVAATTPATDKTPGFDLRLMSWGDGSGVPTAGTNLIIVGIDNNGLLHVRLFDAGGKRVADADETKLPGMKADAIRIIRDQVRPLLPPHLLQRFLGPG